MHPGRALLMLFALLGCSGTSQRPNVSKLEPTRALLPLPGPCVDPAADARASFGPDADEEGLKIERKVDLDGDGVLDPFVTHSSFCGTGGCDFRLYVARGACAHRVGALFGSSPEARTERSNGLLELENAARNGCGGLARTESRARFDGTTYVVYEERTCSCPDEGAADAECGDWKPPRTRGDSVEDTSK